MYFVKTPLLIQHLFANFVWTQEREDKTIHLTFDDGPIPEVTPWVLEQLEEYDAKGTFFCVGDNVLKHPDIYEMVKSAGHTVGNHTFNHLNGWASDNSTYLHNVRRCSHVVDSDLFRPPYGRLKPKQANVLHKHYQIVMWDVLSGDFDPAISKEQCWKNVKHNTVDGSIIVFHDSIKSFAKLKYVLPKVLEYYAERGYSFKAVKKVKMKQAVLQRA